MHRVIESHAPVFELIPKVNIIGKRRQCLRNLGERKIVGRYQPDSGTAD